MPLATFDADNRAGIERTLHRISAIRNRRGEVVGLTCRVGRAVYGTIEIIQDLIESGQSVLLLGPPGVGKTTMLREAARVLAENKRVVIVDTSNEIGGDGDVPHPAVGKARRMQVSVPDHQHEVMIEAVENHNPEVIVIDEIGRELEAQAARTIAERGVQLIGTAHGNALDNLMLNPTLVRPDRRDSVGDARRRGSAPARNAENGAGAPRAADLRRADRDSDARPPDRPRRCGGGGRCHAAREAAAGRTPLAQRSGRSHHRAGARRKFARLPNATCATATAARVRSGNATGAMGATERRTRRNESDAARFEIVGARIASGSKMKAVSVYAYGVARNRLYQAARRLHVPLTLTDDAGQSDMIVTLKNYYRRRPKLIVDAERRGTPIFVLRANTITQMENFLMDVFHKEDTRSTDDPFGEAMRETEAAILQVRSGQEFVDLDPALRDHSPPPARAGAPRPAGVGELRRRAGAPRADFQPTGVKTVCFVAQIWF